MLAKSNCNAPGIEWSNYHTLDEYSQGFWAEYRHVWSTYESVGSLAHNAHRLSWNRWQHFIAVPCQLSQLSVDGQKYHLREFILVRCNGQGKQQVESRLLDGNGEEGECLENDQPFHGVKQRCVYSSRPGFVPPLERRDLTMMLDEASSWVMKQQNSFIDWMGYNLQSMKC